MDEINDNDIEYTEPEQKTFINSPPELPTSTRRTWNKFAPASLEAPWMLLVPYTLATIIVRLL